MPVIQLPKREDNQETVIRLKKEALVKKELPASSEQPASSDQPESSDQPASSASRKRKREGDDSVVKRELSEVKDESELESDDVDYMNTMAVSYAGQSEDEAAWYADKNVESDPYL